MSKPVIRVICAAIVDGGRYLITQRNAGAVLPLLWEFPGGRVEAGETDAQALQRELEFRLGLEARVCEVISQVNREYDTYTVHLHLYRCEMGPRPPQTRKVRDMRWVTLDEIDAYPMTPADQHAMDALLFKRNGKP